MAILDMSNVGCSTSLRATSADILTVGTLTSASGCRLGPHPASTCSKPSKTLLGPTVPTEFSITG